MLSGYNADYLSRLCREKRIAGSQIGRTWLIERASLESFMESQVDRKIEFAESLARERGLEYRKANSPSARITRVTDNLEERMRVVAESVFTALSVVTMPREVSVFGSRAVALGLTALVLAGSVTLAGSGVVSRTGEALLASAFDARSFVLARASHIGLVAQEKSEALILASREEVQKVDTTLAYALDERVETLPLEVSKNLAQEHPSVEVSKVAYGRAHEIYSRYPAVLSSAEIAANVSYAVTHPEETLTAVAHGVLHGYRTIGVFALNDIESVLALHLRMVEAGGEGLFSASVSIRDTAYRAPLAVGNVFVDGSETVMSLYEDGVYAYVETIAVVPETIVGAVYQIGNTSGAVLATGIQLAPGAYEEGVLAFAETSSSVATLVANGSYAFGKGANEQVSGLTQAQDRVIGQGVASVRLALAGLSGRATQMAAVIESGPSAASNEALRFAGDITLRIENTGTQMLSASPLASIDFDRFIPGFLKNVTAVIAHAVGSAFHGVFGPLAGFFGASEEVGLAVIPNEGTLSSGDAEAGVPGDTINYNGPVTIIRNEYPTANYGGVPQSYVDDRLDFLRRTLYNRIEDVAGDRTFRGDINDSRIVDSTINDSSFSNGVIENSQITGGTIVGSALNVATTTITGSLTVDGDLSVSGSVSQNSTTTNFYATNGTIENILGTNATITNATSTNFYATLATILDGFFTNLTATLANITTAVIANLTATDAVFTNATSTNATSTNLFASNLTATSATSTNLFVTSARITTGIIDALTSPLANITTAIIANLTATNASITNATTTNATSTGSLALTYVTPSRLLSVGASGVVGSADLSSWIAGTLNQLTVTDNGIGGITLSLPSTIVIGSSQPTTIASNGATSTFGGGLQATFVEGVQYIAGPYVLATSTTATSAFSGNIAVGRNTTLGTTAADFLTVNSSISSNLIPSANNTYDLGSVGNNWNRIYVDEVVANNISAASSSIAGTVSESFTINSDNATADTEDSTLVFNRGSASPNALITWNSATDRFELNMPIFSADGIFTNATTTNLVATNVTVNGETFTDFTGTNLTNTGGALGLSASYAGQSSITTLGTITSGTWNGSTVGVPYGGTGATSLTGLLIGNGTGAFTATTLSSGIAGQISDETGTGSLVFSNSPTFTGTSVFADLTATNATTTSFFTSTLGLGSGNYFTSLLGNGLTNVGGTLTVSTTSLASGFFQQGGNSFGTTATLGTNDANNLALETGGSTRMTINTSGNVGIGTTTPAVRFSVYEGSSSIAAAFRGGGGPTVGIGSTVDGGRIQAYTNDSLVSVANISLQSAGGNVGIGTTTPASLLQVVSSGGFTTSAQTIASFVRNGSTASDAVVSIIAGNAAKSFLRFGDTDTEAMGIIKYDHALNALTFGTNGVQDLLNITSTGNVGIGTTSPFSPASIGRVLNIFNTTGLNAGINLSSGAEDFEVANVSGDLWFIDDNSTRMVIKNTTGNVGIGETAPGSRLSVSGGATIGASYDTTAAPTNGLLVEGSVGIGTTTPGNLLTVSGATPKIQINSVTGFPSLLFSDGGTTRYEIYSDAAGVLKFVEGGAGSRMVINSGNVGIGTTTPDTTLNVVKGAGKTWTTTAGTVALFERANSSGAAAYISVISGNTGLARLQLGDTDAEARGLVQYDNSSDALSLWTAGTQKLTVLAGGNVGIGTTTPGQTLSVAGTGLFSGLSTFMSGFNIGSETFTSLLGNGLTNVGGTLTVSTTSLASGFFQQGGNSFGTTATLGTNDSNNLALETGGSTRMTIDTSGNVGVGLTSPSDRFEVRAAGNDDGIRLQSSNGSNNLAWLHQQNTDAAILRMYDGGTENIRINSETSGASFFNAGNVGIGTTSPQASLHVAGASGALFGLQAGQVGTLGLTTASAGSPVSGRLTFGSDGTGWQFRIAQNVAGTVTDLFTVETGGNVGIGTTTPSALLSLASGTTAASGIAFGSDVNLYRHSANLLKTDDDITLGSGLYLSNTGEVYGTQLVNNVTGLNAAVAVTTTGVTITRNIADTNPALIVSQAHAGSTGDIMRLNNSAGTVLTVQRGGNVGIGTTSPLSKLHVNAGDITVTNSSANPAYYLGESDLLTAGTYGYMTWDRTSDLLQLGTQAAGPTITMSESGNVSIATTTSLGRLQIAKNSLYTNADGDAGIHILSNTGESALALGADDTNNLAFIQSVQSGVSYSTRPLSLNPNGGNVGIGTTGPGSRFHVEGGGVIINTVGGAGTSIGRHINIGTATPTDWRSYTGSTAAAIQMQNSATEGFVLVATVGATVPRTQFITTGGYEIQVGATVGGAGTTALQILSSGNVGIGTTSPTSLLNVSETGSNSATFGTAIPFRVSSTNSLNSNVHVGLGFERTNFSGEMKLSGVIDIISGTNSAGAENSSMRFGTLKAGTLTQHMIIDSTGNVGIGTTSPVSKLSVVGGAYLGGNVFIGDNQRGYFIGEVNDFSYGVSKSALGSSANLQFSAGSATPRMSITSTGNVGIGTTTPLGRVHILGSEGVVAHPPVGFASVADDLIISNNGSSGITLQGSNSGTNYIVFADAALGGNNWIAYEHANDALAFRVNNAERMRINSAGNVGIGTSTPFSKLSVTGAGTGTGRGFSVANSSNLDNFYVLDNGTTYTRGNITLPFQTNNFIGSASNNGLYFDGSGNYGMSVNSSIGGGIVFESDGGSTGSFFIGTGNEDPDSATKLVTVLQGGNVGIGSTAPLSAFQVGAAPTYNFAVTNPKANIISTNYDPTELTRGTLNLESSSRSAGNNSGLGPSLTFTQNTSQYVDGYEKVIGAIKAYITTNTNASANSSLGFYTHDVGSSLTEQMTINSSGNVGIGTTNPASHKLVVVGGNANTLRIDNAGEQYTSADFFNNGSSKATQYYDNTGSEFVSRTTVAANLGFDTNLTRRMTILSNGNVGIGTASPSYKFTVTESTANGIAGRFAASGTGTPFGVYATALGASTQNTAGYFQASGATTNIGVSADVVSGANNYAIYAGNTAKSYFAGSVGIGTNAPVTRLHVSSATSVATVPSAGASAGAGLLVSNVDSSYGLVAGSLTNGNGFLQSQRVDGLGTTYNLLLQPNGGNVGIGDSNPSRKLSVVGTDVNGNYADFKSASGAILAVGSTATAGRIQAYTNGYGGVAPLILNDAGGNVGIGDTTPDAKFEILQASDTSTQGLQISRSNDSDFMRMYMAAGVGTLSDTLIFSSAFAGDVAAIGRDGSAYFAGKVGIGTSSPDTNLSVVGNITGGTGTTMKITNLMAGTVASPEYATLAFNGYLAGPKATIQALEQTGNTWASQLTFTINDGSGASSMVERMRINGATGNVGIGTSTPSTLLETYRAAANNTLKIAIGGGTGHTYSPKLTLSRYAATDWSLSQPTGSYDFTIDQDGARRVTIQTSSGNVGIGTTSPYAKLSIVDGDGSADTTLALNNRFKFRGDGVMGWGSAAATGILSWDGSTAIVGSQASSDLAFITNGTSLSSERMRITTGGNVGIGTTTPTSALDVAGNVTTRGQHVFFGSTSNSAFALGLQFDSTYQGVSNVFRFRQGGSTAGGVAFSVYDAAPNLFLTAAGTVGIGTATAGSALTVAGNIETTNGANRSLILRSASNYSYSLQATSDDFQILEAGDAAKVRFHIDYPNGNVGIGTTAPGAKLTVVGDTWLNGITNGGTFNLALNAASGNGIIVSNGADASVTNNRRVVIGQSGTNGGLGLFYNNAGTIGVRLSGVTNDASYFNNGGNVGIGTTNPLNMLVVGGTQAGNAGFEIVPGSGIVAQSYNRTSSAYASLNFDGSSIGFRPNGSTMLTANTTGVLVANLVSCAGVQTNGSGLMSCTSDANLKDVQSAFTTGLSGLRGINPQTYTWKSGTDYFDGGVEYSGFIAQNVGANIPEAMNEGANGFKQISTTAILAASINAIKELDVRTLSLAPAAENQAAHTLAVSSDATIAGMLTVTGIGTFSDSLTAASILSNGSVTATSFLTETTDTLPSEVLTGGSADLYKMANYALTGMQALAERTDLILEQLDTIDSRLAALELSQSAEPGFLGISPAMFTSLLAGVGIVFEEGMTSIEKLVAERLTVGSVEKPTGITLYDEETGEPYCLSIGGGSQNITEGECEIATPTTPQTPPTPLPPPTDPVVEDEETPTPPEGEEGGLDPVFPTPDQTDTGSDSEPTPEPEPAPAPEPEPAPAPEPAPTPTV